MIFTTNESLKAWGRIDMYVLLGVAVLLAVAYVVQRLSDFIRQQWSATTVVARTGQPAGHLSFDNPDRACEQVIAPVDGAHADAHPVL
jgi:hypothetical protein